MSNSIKELFDKTYDKSLAQKDTVKLKHGYGLPNRDEYLLLEELCQGGGSGGSAEEIKATVPKGLPPETPDNVQGILDALDKKPSGVQSDWNVNNPDDPAYVKNRPFYSRYTEILKNGEYNFAKSKYGIPSIETSIEDLIISNDTEYSIKLDGVSYIRNVKNSRVGGYIFIGNGSIINPMEIADSGEPFVITKPPGEEFVIFITIKEGLHTVEFIKIEYVQLSEKYMLHKPGKSGVAAYSEVFNDLNGNVATGLYSHAEGTGTIASRFAQHVEGSYNIEDTTGRYLHIAGSGDEYERYNAHTLDWQGNSWYQGEVLVGGEDMDAPDAELTPTGVIIKSSTPGSAKRYRITVDDTGAIKAEEVVATP